MGAGRGGNGVPGAPEESAAARQARGEAGNTTAVGAMFVGASWRRRRPASCERASTVVAAPTVDASDAGGGAEPGGRGSRRRQEW